MIAEGTRLVINSRGQSTCVERLMVGDGVYSPKTGHTVEITQIIGRCVSELLLVAPSSHLGWPVECQTRSSIAGRVMSGTTKVSQEQAILLPRTPTAGRGEWLSVPAKTLLTLGLAQKPLGRFEGCYFVVVTEVPIYMMSAGLLLRSYSMNSFDGGLVGRSTARTT